MNSRPGVKSEESAASAPPAVHVSGGPLDQVDQHERVEQASRIEEARLLLAMATDFRRDAWPDKARRFARRALVIFERELGTDHSDVVPALLCMAGAREDLTDYARAETEYRRANEILDRIPDCACSLDVPRLRIQTMCGLAGAVRALGRNRQAETMLTRALVAVERSFGSEHAEVATVLNDLGAHYRHTGRYEEASRLHRRALAITENALGREHPQMAAILHQLAVLERARGQFVAGEPLARRCVAIREKTLGPDHPQVAADCVVIASLLEGQGRYGEAKSMYQRAFTALERWFRPDRPDAAMTVNHVDRVFHCAVDDTPPRGAKGVGRCA